MAEMRVTVCFSPAARQVFEQDVQLPEGCDLTQALALACALPAWPQDWPLSRCLPLAVGLWGRKVDLHERLRDGDRVELCRPLRVDPKVARRERFGKQGARTAGLFAQKRPGAATGY